jgi:hypothetical protein
VASDCANTIRSIQGERLGRYGAIVVEIMSRMESFARIKFIFEGQNLNFDAHILARNYVNLAVGRYVWFLEALNGICNSYFVE